MTKKYVLKVTGFTQEFTDENRAMERMKELLDAGIVFMSCNLEETDIA